jgi:Ca-activated chloride channel homolog
MKLLLIVATLALVLTDLDKIGKINSLKSEAKQAYSKGDFKTAIEKYRYLVDSLGVKEEEVLLNLANSYFNEKDTAHVQTTYLPLTQSKNTKLNSIANQQLGVVANRQGKLEEALNYFKQALKTAPDNEDARYNYEMVKKKIEDKKKEDQKKKDKENKDNKKDDKKDQKNDQQNKEKKDKEKKDQEKKDKEKKDQEKKDKEQKDKKDQSKEEKDKEKKDKEQQQKDEEQKKKEEDKKDNKPSPAEKLKDMQISEEKAKMILEAMKAQEVQYLQQNKRKATKPKDKGKPDW